MGKTGKIQEDLYFHKRDVELLEMQKSALRKAQEREARKSHQHHCAHCGGETTSHAVKDVSLDVCRECRAVTVAHKDVDKVLKVDFSSMLHEDDKEFQAA